MMRFIGPLLTIILVLAVSIAIFFSVRSQLESRRVVTVQGLIGSEKEEFFQDERVQEILRRHGFEVVIEKAGSRQIATSFDLGQYDFAFPAGVPAAEKIRREQGVSTSYNAFFTPMAMASWKPIAGILAANGVVEDRGDYLAIDVEKLLALMEDDTRWTELQNSAAYPVDKGVLVASTDVRTSNSAAMYLALASYVANGNQIVQDESAAQALLPFLGSLFLRQGFLEYSSESPFEDYLVMGMGKAPLVMIYEAQYISRAAANDGSILPDMVLLYPEPTIFTKHILIPLSEAGERLGEAMETDPDLQRLAIEYGFRNDDMAYFREYTDDAGLTMPQSLVNVIEPPSYEVLESMIQAIEAEY
jgi:hypothetical protein